jgi:hypothetical protein
MLFGETVAVYCENHTEHTNTLCAECTVLVDGSYNYHSTLKVLIQDDKK